MIIAIDFDGTIITRQSGYSDRLTPYQFMPGAEVGLHALKTAGHILMLWSSRSATRGLMYAPSLDPILRLNGYSEEAWKKGREISIMRYRRMLEFIDQNLPGIFDVIDDGQGGKPLVDLFIDDKTVGGVNWNLITLMYGEMNYGEASKNKATTITAPTAIR